MAGVNIERLSRLARGGICLGGIGWETGVGPAAISGKAYARKWNNLVGSSVED